MTRLLKAARVRPRPGSWARTWPRGFPAPGPAGGWNAGSEDLLSSRRATLDVPKARLDARFPAMQLRHGVDDAPWQWRAKLAGTRSRYRERLSHPGRSQHAGIHGQRLRSTHVPVALLPHGQLSTKGPGSPCGWVGHDGSSLRPLARYGLGRKPWLIDRVEGNRPLLPFPSTEEEAPDGRRRLARTDGFGSSAAGP